MSRRAVVIGAGMVGLASALHLLDDGLEVTIVDPGPPGGEQSASYGNGTVLNPGSIIPVSTPGLWRKVPGYLIDTAGPFTLRWRHLPQLAPWLLRFLRAGWTVDRVAATARALAPLLADCPERHRRLAEAAGVAPLIHRRGMLYPYPDRAAFEADALGWRLRRDHGIAWTELDEGALRQQEPLLDRRYTFAAFVPGAANVSDPGAYLAALGAHAAARGARHVRARATGFRVEDRRLRAVRTDAGEIEADAAVIAAGAHARPLARAAGDRVSLEAERGYHIVVSEPGLELRHPMLTSDTKVAVVSTATGLRVAGTVELASVRAAPDWRRAHVLKDVLRRTLTGVPAALPEERVKVWMGSRPSTPDGLPVIGPASATDDIVHAFGHGHVGLAAGAMTGHLVANIIAGRRATIDIAPFRAQRFHQ